jgi:4-amino-4-deoxy-L-arabinose transferase-like glycosyltransferase
MNNPMTTLARRWQPAVWIVLSVILVVAALLRLYRPGIYLLEWDEVILLHISRNIARSGEWSWIGNPASSPLISYHSPLPNYFNALIFALTPDPLVTRTILGILNVGAVLALFFAGRRWSGNAAGGLFAAFLLAVMVYAIHWSRFVWNPNYAQVFFALWLYSAIPAYFEAQPRRWAVIVHWLSVGFLIQAQIANAYLIVPSGVLLLRAVRVRPLWAWLRLHGWVWLVTALTYLPWAIGLWQYRTPSAAADTSRSLILHWPSWAEVSALFSGLVSGTQYPYPFPIPLLAQTDVFLPPEWVRAGLTGYSILIALWLVAMIGWGVFKRRWAWVWLGSVPFFSFIISFISYEIFDRYLMSVTIGAALAGGIGLGVLWSRGRWTKVIALILAGGYGVGQLWLMLAILGALNTNAIAQTWQYPMGMYRPMLDEWLASGAMTLLIADEPNSDSVQTLNHAWSLTAAGRPMHQITPDTTGIPFYTNGTLLVITATSTRYADLLTDTQTTGTLLDGAPIYKWQILAVDDQPSITDAAPAITYRDGAQLRGFVLPDALEAGTSVPFQLIWQTGQTKPDGIDKFSLRLIHAETGQRYAQWDGVSLGATLWQADTTVLNSGEFGLPPDMPDAPLAFEIIRYEEVSGTMTHFSNPDGNPGGDVLRFPLSE